MLGLTPFLNLLAEEAEYQQGELMGIALGPLLLAVILFWIGVKLQNSGKPHWIKWIALVPLAVGLIMGIAPLQAFYGDPMYQQYYGGTWKKGAAHMAGVLMPILGAVGLAVWNKWLNRQKFDEL